MKTDNRKQIRTALEAHLINAGDLVYLHPDTYPPYDMQRLRVAVAQIIAHVPYTASIRTIDGHIVVRRDTPADTPALPGMLAVNETQTLLAMRPWPDDPMFDEKSRYINQLMNPVSVEVRQ